MQKYLFISVIITCLLSYIAQDFGTASPAVQPVDAPGNIYSGDRAFQILNTIIREDAPHPSGSKEHLAVKHRIQDWLTEHQISFNTQDTWGCSNAAGRCSPVSNIIATIPGETGNPSIALMAHYDSTPASDGAGDNGAGVATILEIGRMLKDQPLTNPIMLLITDGEENGLLGAEAFFTQHPDRNKVGVVLNLEASTSSGRSVLFRTSTANQTLVNIYGKHAPSPGGTSLYNEVFKHMPSDTDFSVPLRHGYAGMDFVFVGDKQHHHTRLDNLDNLSIQSLQHHGDNLFPLAKQLSSLPFSVEEDEEVTFLNLFGYWISWPLDLSFLILFVALGFLAIAATRTVENWRHVLASATLPLAIFVFLSFASGAAFLLTHLINGTTPFWPAHLTPYRMMLFGIPFAIALLLAPRFNAEIDLKHSLIGIWVFWGLLALVFSIWLPPVAYLFVLPLGVASITLFTASFCRENVAAILCLLSLPLVVALHLHLVLLLEQSQGYWFIASTFVFLSLFMACVLPLLRGILVKSMGRMMVFTAIGGFIGAVLLPGFSEYRPQTAIYQLVEDTDKNDAWLQFLSLNKVPAYLEEHQAFDEQAQIFPWSDNPEKSLTSVPVNNLKAPFVEVVSDSSTGQERTVTLRLESLRNARDLGIVIPLESRAANYTIDGREYPFEPMDWGTWKNQHALEFRGIQGRSIELTIRFEMSAPVTAHVYDITQGIPSTYNHLIEAREPLVVQVHQGDRTLALRQIAF